MGWLINHFNNQSHAATKVEGAMKSLQNGLTPGPDGVTMNCSSTYAIGTVSESFAEAVFEQYIVLEVLDKGILVALPEPDKPLGHSPASTQ